MHDTSIHPTHDTPRRDAKQKEKSKTNNQGIACKVNKQNIFCISLSRRKVSKRSYEKKDEKKASHRKNKERSDAATKKGNATNRKKNMLKEGLCESNPGNDKKSQITGSKEEKRHTNE